jgi:shikimate dehydrogenase
VVSGLAVLLHQAVAQVELMTGRPGPVEAMRAALDAAVRARQH